MNGQPQLPQSVSIVPSNVRQDDSETSGGSKRPTSGNSKSLPSINFPDEIIRDYRLMKELPCEVIFHKCKKVYNPVSNGSVVESPLPSFVVITAVAIAASVVAAPFAFTAPFAVAVAFAVILVFRGSSSEAPLQRRALPLAINS